MISKNEIVLLLTELERNGVEGASKQIKDALLSKNIEFSTLKFINDNRPLEIIQFYERMRKNYNNKKSPLYKNIVKDIDDIEEIITTLHAYSLQVNLFSKKLDNKQLFFKHAREEEVTRVLNKYYTDYDITSAVKVLRLIKADLVAFETIAGRR